MVVKQKFAFWMFCRTRLLFFGKNAKKSAASRKKAPEKVRKLQIWGERSSFLIKDLWKEETTMRDKNSMGELWFLAEHVFWAVIWMVEYKFLFFRSISGLCEISWRMRK